MSELFKTVRKDYVALLEENGITAYEYATSDIVPPAVLVVPDEEYIRGITFGTQTFLTYKLAVNMLVLVGPGTDTAALDSFEDMIEKIMVTFSTQASTVVFERVRGPGIVIVNGVKYFGTVINTTYDVSYRDKII